MVHSHAVCSRIRLWGMVNGTGGEWGRAEKVKWDGGRNIGVPTADQDDGDHIFQDL